MEARRERKTRATDRERGREKGENRQGRGADGDKERGREKGKKKTRREKEVRSEKTRREGLRQRWGGPQASSRVGERTGPCPSEGLNLKKDVEGKNYWDRKDAKGKWENRDGEGARD
jgi:hypothetical protein